MGGMRLDAEHRFDIQIEMAFEIREFGRSWEKRERGIEIERNDHYQNVDLGLEFLLEASKPPKNPSLTNKYQKLRKRPQKTNVSIVNPGI